LIAALATGAAAGLAMGYVLQRGQLCFYSAISDTRAGGTTLLRGWVLGVALGSVGLATLYLLPGTGDLNTGLAFRPVANVAGGLIIGVGMAVAMSCVSSLFFKLGSGMLGAAAGLAGWVIGELVAKSFTIPGPLVLSGGEDATLPGLLGVPRLLVALVVAGCAVGWIWTHPEEGDNTENGRWSARRLGIALAAAITAGWALAALGGSSFGPSSVGASASVAAGSPNYWLIAGGYLAASLAGNIWIRGEQPVRYAQLGLGGILLGAGGWIAGGCNLGHGLSGAAQLNVSSFVVVLAMVAGLAATRAVLPKPTPAARP
jgi:hypothetical protein